VVRGEHLPIIVIETPKHESNGEREWKTDCSEEPMASVAWWRTLQIKLINE
jgi:hypothetical protein